MKFAASAFALALVFIFAEQAAAAPNKHRVEALPVPSMMVDETGTPVIKQGLERPKGATQDRHRHHTNRSADRRLNTPRGSPTFVLPVAETQGLPRTPLLVQPPAVAPYNPPPINNPSEGVMQSDQSFPLNRGLGNNPSDRDSYVRDHFNN
jgi:hypothetical protein